jgi:hypothetical protein
MNAFQILSKFKQIHQIFVDSDNTVPETAFFQSKNFSFDRPKNNVYCIQGWEKTRVFWVGKWVGKWVFLSNSKIIKISKNAAKTH